MHYSDILDFNFLRQRVSSDLKAFEAELDKLMATDAKSLVTSCDVCKNKLIIGPRQIEKLKAALNEEKYSNAIFLGKSDLPNNPALFFQVLWNRLYWYDKPEAWVFEDNETTKKAGLIQLCEHWRHQVKDGENLTWLRSLGPLEAHLDSAVSGYLNASLNTPAGLCWLDNERLAAFDWNGCHVHCIGNGEDRSSFFTNLEEIIVADHIYDWNGNSIAYFEEESNAVFLRDTKTADIKYQESSEKKLKCIALSPCSKKLALLLEDGSVEMIDTSASKKCELSADVLETVIDVAWYDSCQLLLIAEQELRFIDIDSLELVKIVPIETPLGADLVHLNDPKVIAHIREDKIVELIDVDTGTLIQKLIHSDVVWGVDVSRDKSIAVTTSWDGFIKVWHVESGSLTRKICDGNSFGAVAISPDNEMIAVSEAESGYGMVSLWNTSTGISAHSKNIYEGFCSWYPVFSVCSDFIVTKELSFDDKHLVIKLWDLDGKLVKKHSFIKDNDRILNLSSSGGHALLLSDKGEVSTFDVVSGKRTPWPILNDTVSAAISEQPHSCVVSDDGEIVAGFDGCVLFIGYLSPEGKQKAIKYYKKVGIKRIFFTTGKNVLVTVDIDNSVALNRGMERWAHIGSPDKFRSNCVISNNQRYIAFSAGKGYIVVYDTWSEIKRYRNFKDDFIDEFDFSADSKRLLINRAKSTTVVAADSLETIEELPPVSGNLREYVSNRLYCRHTGQIEIVDKETDEVVAIWPTHLFRARMVGDRLVGFADRDDLLTQLVVAKIETIAC